MDSSVAAVLDAPVAPRTAPRQRIRTPKSKWPRARNELHLALTANDADTVAKLIEDGDEMMLNQQSTAGCTPLMLLAMGHCEESLMWRLLERNGSLNVAARSHTRRTAADYAALKESKRSVAVMEALQALEAAEMQRTAGCRCCVCGDTVKKWPLLAHFWQSAEKGEESNQLLQRFFASECYRELLKPQYHLINDVRQLRKELSESLAVMEALVDSVPDFSCNWHVVDLCCGKSVTSILISLKYPGITVTAVDKLEPRFVPHMDIHGASCVYAQLDVLDDAFVVELGKLVEKSGRQTVLLGMHLCGRLSLQAVEAFAQVDAIQAVVLSPCCLPRKEHPLSPPYLYTTKDPNEQYQRWAFHLESALRKMSRQTCVASQTVADILSPKNIVMCAVKEPLS